MKDSAIIVGMATVAVIIGVIIFLNGGVSNTQLATSVSGNDQTATSVSFTKITSGTQSSVTRRVNYIITSASELNELWKMINTSSKPPVVDFKKNSVIAVFAGRQPTVGHVIEVAKIEDSNVRNVSLALVRPDASCMVAQMITTPYEIITVPATALSLAHIDQVVTTADCPE